MKTQTTLNQLLYCLCVVLFFNFKSFSQSNTKPNIILILTDDMGYADVGYNNGNVDIATPNIDALANGGSILTDAYATHPFCGPSRAGLMTGRYPHEFGAQFNLSDSDTTHGVSLTETFISTVLDDAGYNTGVIGKWHLGQPTGYRPNQRGFDYFYGMLYGGHVYFTGGTNGTIQYTSPLRKNEGLAGETNGQYITDLFSDEGVDFIDRAETNDTEPFFLFMSYNAPHTPIEALTSDKNALTAAPYNFIYSDTQRHDYAAMVYSIDRGVGRLVQALTANGELDNTLIVFMSDNGGRTDRGGVNTPLRGRKGDTFDGGFRVPMFMHWPAQIPAGVTYNHNVSALDLYSTFADIAGATIPIGKEIDGKNIIANIKNGTDARSGESIYSIRHRGRGNNVGIRRDNLKAFSTGDGTWFLYDLDTNISESNSGNLANNPMHKDILADMINDAYQWSLTHMEPLDNISGVLNPWNNNNGSTWQDTTFNGFTTLSVNGVELKQDESGGYIYPNPAINESNLTIAFNTNVTENVGIVIYDALGRVIKAELNLKTTASNKASINLNSITRGNYFVKVTSGRGSFKTKLIIK